MLAGVKIVKGSTVSIRKGGIYIENNGSRLLLIFEDLATIESVSHNLDIIAQGIRAKETIKEVVENGN